MVYVYSFSLDSRGTEMFEIDVQLTKDGEVVVCHDDDLIRTTGRKIEISQCDYDELPPLSTSLAVTFASPGNGLAVLHLKVIQAANNVRIQFSKRLRTAKFWACMYASN